MTLVEHSLGESEHIYAKSNLKLKTRCSVKLSSSLGAVFPFSILFKELDTLVSSATWIARGNGLRISMQLVTNDVTTQHFDRDTLLESLSAIFCGAELWKQLNLKACAVLHLHEGLSFPLGDLCFSLSNLRSTLGSVEKSDGIIHLPAHDIKQPFGVPFAFLTHIQMTFIFSSLGGCSNSKSSKLISGGDIRSHVLLMDSHLVEHLNQSALPEHLSQDPKRLSLEHDRQFKSAIQQSRNIQDPRNIICGLPFTANSPPSFQNCVLGSLFQSPVDQLPPMKLPVKRAASDFFPNEEKIILADLAKLFDAGLRTMISGDKIQLLSGVTSSICQLGPKLAEISPAMFRPGYLPAIWEHYRFFDAIAHTTSIIYSHQSCVGLRSKIEALKRFLPDEFEGNDMLDDRMPRTPEQALINAVKVRLWRMTVSQTLRRPGITAIKPLGWTDRFFVQSRDGQIMQEDESSSSSGNFAGFRSEAVDDALLFEDDEESDTLLENETLFREDDLDGENDELDEDLLSGDCVTMEEFDTVEALDIEEENWVWEGDYVSKVSGERDVHSDSEDEILFEDDEEILLDDVVPHHEHDSSRRRIYSISYDEVLMSN